MAFFFSQLKEFLPIFLKLAGCWGGLNLTAVASFNIGNKISFE